MAATATIWDLATPTVAVGDYASAFLPMRLQGAAPDGTQDSFAQLGLRAAFANLVGYAVDPTTTLQIQHFGADPTNTADVTTAIQQAINALPARGGTVMVPGGDYRIATGLISTGGKSVRIVGAGRSATFLRVAHPTNDIFVHTGNDGFGLQDLTILADVQRMAGAYVRIDPGAGNINYSSYFSNCSMIGYYVGIDFVRAASWTIGNCVFLPFSGSNMGLSIANITDGDIGDSTVYGSLFSGAGLTAGTGGTHIFQASSGGLRLSNNKVLYGVKGYELALDLTEGASPNTSILLIETNSFEGQTGAALSFSRAAGTGTFSYVVITGNEIAYAPIALRMTGDGTDLLDFIFANNVVNVPASGTGIIDDGAAHTRISENTFVAGGAGTTAISLTVNSFDTEIGSNGFVGIATPVSDASTSTTYIAAPFDSTGTLKTTPAQTFASWVRGQGAGAAPGSGWISSPSFAGGIFSYLDDAAIVTAGAVGRTIAQSGYARTSDTFGGSAEVAIGGAAFARSDKLAAGPTGNAAGNAGTYVAKAVACATVGDIALSGLPEIDGYQVVANDRVLVKDNTDQTQNGIYIASSGTWARAADFSTWSQVVGAALAILNGTTLGGQIWGSSSAASGTVGTTPITFAGPYPPSLAGAWGRYISVYKDAGVLGPLAGYEIDVAVESDQEPIYPAAPEGTGGPYAIALALASGGEATATPGLARTFSAFLNFTSNDPNLIANAWTGLNFHRYALRGTDGVTGSGLAFQLSNCHFAQWYDIYNNPTGAIGADPSANMTYAMKMRFADGGMLFSKYLDDTTQFRILPLAGAVNYLMVQGGATGVAPALSANGTDTDIDLELYPKGGGLVMFGAYTDTTSSIAGYITIKDASGTPRKLAVVS